MYFVDILLHLGGSGLNSSAYTVSNILHLKVKCTSLKGEMPLLLYLNGSLGFGWGGVRSLAAHLLIG